MVKTKIKFDGIIAGQIYSSNKKNSALQQMKKEVTIIGAGMVGSLLSIYLVKRGYKVKVYERRGDMRIEQVVAGRTINLTQATVASGRWKR